MLKIFSFKIQIYLSVDKQLEVIACRGLMRIWSEFMHCCTVSQPLGVNQNISLAIVNLCGT